MARFGLGHEEPFPVFLFTRPVNTYNLAHGCAEGSQMFLDLTDDQFRGSCARVLAQILRGDKKNEYLYGIMIYAPPPYDNIAAFLEEMLTEWGCKVQRV